MLNFFRHASGPGRSAPCRAPTAAAGRPSPAGRCRSGDLPRLPAPVSRDRTRRRGGPGRLKPAVPDRPIIPGRSSRASLFGEHDMQLRMRGVNYGLDDGAEGSHRASPAVRPGAVRGADPSVDGPPDRRQRAAWGARQALPDRRRPGPPGHGDGRGLGGRPVRPRRRRGEAGGPGGPARVGAAASGSKPTCLSPRTCFRRAGRDQAGRTSPARSDSGDRTPRRSSFILARAFGPGSPQERALQQEGQVGPPWSQRNMVTIVPSWPGRVPARHGSC